MSKSRTVLVQNITQGRCARAWKGTGRVREAYENLFITIKRSEALKNVRPFQDDDPHDILDMLFFNSISNSLFTFFSQVMANEASGLQLAMVSVLYG